MACPNYLPELLGGALARLRRRLLVHHGPASGAQIGPVLLHAGGGGSHIGGFRSARAEPTAGGHLVRLSMGGKRRRCREWRKNRGNRHNGSVPPAIPGEPRRHSRL